MHQDHRPQEAPASAPARTRRGDGPGFGSREKTLLLGALVGLGLALALYVTQAAEPAEAHVRNYCSHTTVYHRGPEGRLHKQVFERSYGSANRHYHVVAHFTKFSRNGASKWAFNWRRHFYCPHNVNTRETGHPDGIQPDRRAPKTASVAPHGQAHGHAHGHPQGHPQGHAQADEQPSGPVSLAPRAAAA